MGLRRKQLQENAIDPENARLDAVGYQTVDIVQKTYLTAVNGAPGAGQFRSSITNRAPILDPSANLEVLGPVNRIITQQIYQIPGEFGPNGEPVWGAVNDQWGMIRFVGSGWTNNNANQGPSFYSSNVGDYAEITFYGTNLNLLGLPQNDARSVTVSVDGGAFGSNILPGASASTVLSGRNYASNAVIPAPSAPLTAGIHTVQLKCANIAFSVFGFEILNESSTLRVNPGTYLSAAKAYLKAAASTLPFKPTGYVGTTGAKVVVYEAADGTVGQVYTNVGSPLYLSSADHSNEEIIRKFYPREFGCGRSDDMSTWTYSSMENRAFTIDDNLHTLVAYQCAMTTGDQIVPFDTNAFFTFTFVGTGLDYVQTAGASGASDSTTVYVDGTSVGSLTTRAIGKFKICSGLKFGTHTVKMLRTANPVGGIPVGAFITYGPKTPAIPSGAKALSEYFVTADYVTNASNGNETVAAGVIRHQNIREMVYVGSWSVVDEADVNNTAFKNVRTSTNSDYAECVFEGMGFDARGFANNDRGNIQFQLQSLSTGGSLQNLTATNFPTATFFKYGYTGTFDSSTGVLNQNNGTFIAGCGAGVYGLPFGTYKLRMTKSSGTYFGTNALDIISPIYAPKYIGPFALQATSMIGNTSLCDKRELGVGQTRVSRMAVISGQSTSSTSYVPLGEVVATYYSSGEMVRIDMSALVALQSGSGMASVRVLVDGVVAGSASAFSSSVGQSTAHLEVPMYLAPGFHVVTADVILYNGPGQYWIAPTLTIHKVGDKL